jgi:hypothetical protein
MIFVLIIVFITFAYVRHSDTINAKDIWNKLLKQTKEKPINFEISMLDDAPELVKKFFLYMIKPGTPLHNVSVLEVHGELSMGNSEKSKYIKVKCKQILAPLHGFVWKVKSKGGLIRFSGSDGLYDNHCWSRMWIMNVWPLSQKNLDDNITKSSFGRMTAESTIWALASLLPQKNVHWEVIDNKKIRVTVTTQLMSQHVDITVTSTGQPTRIVFPRWTNVNPQKKFQFQPFGAKLSSFKEVQGFMIPMQIEAGNHYGTKDYFPSYKMIVDSYEIV